MNNSLDEELHHKPPNLSVFSTTVDKSRMNLMRIWGPITSKIMFRWWNSLILWLKMSVLVLFLILKFTMIWPDIWDTEREFPRNCTINCTAMTLKWTWYSNITFSSNIFHFPKIRTLKSWRVNPSRYTNIIDQQAKMKNQSSKHKPTLNEKLQVKN